MSGVTLVVGATGYVGSRLVPQLADAGQRVRCLLQWPEHLRGRVPESVETVHADDRDQAAVAAALAGVDLVYVLMPAPGGSSLAVDAELRVATRLGSLARAAGVRRIVYFGGFGAPPPSDGTPGHRGAGDALRDSGVPVSEVRASVILGPGSLSFELVRAIAERLPLVPVPRWMRASVRPVFLGDLLAALQEAAAIAGDAHATVEAAGPDVVTYEQLIRTYARLRNLRRWWLPLPTDARLPAELVVRLAVPRYTRIGRRLIALARQAGLDDPPAPTTLGFRPMGVEEALRQVMRMEAAGAPGTRWSSVVSAEDVFRHWGGTWYGNRLVDTRVTTVPAPATATFAAVEGIGGARGWYSTPLLWWLRGWMDVAVGGVGMRRGRRDPDRLERGDVVDCWRVAGLERARRLLLEAEMKLPGRGWLEFEVRPDPDGGSSSSLRQTASFDPLGLGGLLYWYSLWPFHNVIFAQMLRGISREAQRLAEQAGSR